MLVEYPYQNLSLEDMPGEKWAPILGFEDSYEISSSGRIKSLAKSWIMHNGYECHIKERILKLTARKIKNVVVNDTKTTLFAGLRKRGKGSRTVSIGRLVYYHFVGPFDLNDHKYVVSYKDGDGCNIRPDNLTLISISKLGREAYVKGRNRSTFSANSRPVSQFDTEGNFIAQYEGCYQAGMATGFKNSGIYKVALGKGQLSQGYIWQHSGKENLQPQKLQGARDGTLNFSQMEKFGIRVPLPRQLATFNLDLGDMPGEHWKFLPGYSEKYMISNLGRTKALKRVTDGQVKQWLPERMLRLHVTVKKNKNGKVSPSSVIALFKHLGDHVTLYVARWVYFLFVGEFDIKDRHTCVYYKDLDPLNLASDNLFLERSNHSFRQGKHTG
jgi:hypothetical protein